MNTLSIAPLIDEQMYKSLHQLPPIAQREVEPKKPHPRAGFMKGMVTWMSDDFNAPLEDFKDYM
jgi:hypothetical protein